MIKPGIGRHVWYYKPGHADGTQPQAGIITCIWSDTCVNLAIFDHNGNAMVNPPTSILLVQPGAERPTGGHFCTWLPDQLQRVEAQTKNAAKRKAKADANKPVAAS